MLKKAFFNWLLLLTSLTVSFVFAELAVRGYLYIKDSVRSFDLVIGTYQKIPRSKGTRYQFDTENNLQFKADVRYNNWGYRSDFDWREDKDPGEFRIAVFGDSYTECEPNDFSWVDVLHKKLSANTDLLNRINHNNITVANFGRSGAGFQLFAAEYLDVRERFKPDLTVFAFIDEDFERLVAPVGGGRRSIQEARTKRTIPRKHRGDISGYLKIPGFGGHLYAVPSGPKVFDRLLYYAGNDDRVILDKENLRSAKRFLATTVAREKYLKSWDCELFKLVKSTIKNRFRSFSAPAEGSDRERDFLTAFYESVDVVGPEPLLLVNLPTFYETVNQHSKMGPLRAPKYYPSVALQQSSLRFIPLADFLPNSASYEEKYSWFTLPWDGHPSNHGAELFGATLSKLLEDFLAYSIAGIGSPYMFLTGERARELRMMEIRTKEREEKEAKAYQVLEIGRTQRDQKNYDRSLELFSEVLSLAPHLGMPGLLYVERGDIYHALGRDEEALADYARAIAINPHKSFLIRHVSIAYALGKLDLVTGDINKLEECCRDAPEVKQLLEQLASVQR